MFVIIYVGEDASSCAALGPFKSHDEALDYGNEHLPPDFWRDCCHIREVSMVLPRVRTSD